MKKIVLLLSFSYFYLCVYGQSKFGKVTKKELAETESSIDKEAEAEFKINAGSFWFFYDKNFDFFKLKKRIKVRLKIYKKNEAENWANVIIPYYKDEIVANIKALTHNLENGKIVTHKLKKKEIFKEKVDEKWTNIRFALSNVKDGSILEWRYTITSPYLWNMGKWYFQYSIPVQYSSLTVTVPEYFNYKPHFYGFVKVHKVNRSIGSESAVIVAGLSNVVYSTKITEFIFKNVSPMKTENFIFNINNYRTFIEYEIASISIPYRPVKYLTQSWKSIAKNLMKNEYFGLQLKKSIYLNRKFEDLLPELEGKNLIQKTKFLFNYVRKNIKWNGKQSLYVSEGVKKAFDTRMGNSAEINFILIALLRKSGINAYPFVLSTVDHGKIDYIFPSLSHLNYVMTVVQNEKKEVFLMDPSSKFSNINILPYYCLNYKGFIIYDNDYKQIDLLYSKTIDNITIECSINKDEELEGTYSKYSMGTNTITERNKLEKSEEDFIESIQQEYSEILKKEISFENKTNIDLSLGIKYKFIDNINIQFVGDKLLVNPLLFVRQSENPFKKEERVLPVEIGSQVEENNQITIQIPQEYTIEYMPKSKKFQLPNNFGEYSIYIKHINNTIKVKKQMKLYKPIYSATEASILREMFLKIIEIENDNIVLVKKKESF